MDPLISGGKEGSQMQKKGGDKLIRRGMTEAKEGGVGRPVSCNHAFFRSCSAASVDRSPPSFGFPLRSRYCHPDSEKERRKNE